LHARLETSPAYRETRNLRENCLRYQKLLLEALPEELAAYWSAQLKQADFVSCANGKMS